MSKPQLRLMKHLVLFFSHKQIRLRRANFYKFIPKGSKQIFYFHVSLTVVTILCFLFSSIVNLWLTFEVFYHQLLGLAWFRRVVGQWRTFVKVISISGEIRFPLRFSHRGIRVFDAFHAWQCPLFLMRVKIQLTLQRSGCCDARSVPYVVTQSTFFPRSTVFRHVWLSLVHAWPLR